ncbi:penicillin-binding protein 1C [Fulvivirgaceae bacterium PWU4]|uniref:peptidoglycan glycosyltransferase n=1 Tax=Chryseosolibacter histidini TaxID=2782349 RepID=A0AAP2GMU9_9BACT|nr:penicillin-binding protein 1C [Chryseosolibacter histidini]
MDYKYLSAKIREICGKRTLLAFVTVSLLIIYWFSLPSTLFEEPYSTVLESSDGELLSASIAKDGQWRFPAGDTVPDKFAEALILFEDKRFYSHPGVDLLSLGRALRQNISEGKVVSGGSTLSMQVIRLSRKGKSRSLFQKTIELVLATRLEIRYSKAEILSLYAAHAPFGGNVVGLEAACWRYFGIDAANLSWAEAALLAVLPNSPAMIHPGKNREQLKAKRDRLLDKLRDAGKIDAFTCALAKEEPVPEQPHVLPRLARHLLARMAREGFAQQKITSTLNQHLQRRVEQIVRDHHERLKANQIFNAAVLVLEVKTGHVLAYAGNVDSENGLHGGDVDIIASPRSTGSILKPFLYAAMLHEGKILPRTLLPDVPVQINGFAPKNFSKEYDGAVAADKALIRSLNVPAVHMLRDYRYEKFHRLLKDAGMTTLARPADHYGLSLILGGAEGTLWDITGMYASMARTLNNYFEHPGRNRYNRSDFHAPVYFTGPPRDDASLENGSWLNAGSIYLTFEALKEVYRPGEETGWRYFNNAKQIAWKTGTSFGHRDGWAVGVTPDYAVGVWAGNADGEGRPGLTGTEAAAPLMFDIFSQLDAGAWFHQPKAEMQQIVTCKKSGYRVSPYCDERDTIWVTSESLNTKACPYHKMVHLTADMKFQVHSECVPLNKMTHTTWFALPPVQEYYFKSRNLSYRSLPPFRADCQSSSLLAGMDMIYPKPDARIFIPRDIDGNPGSSVFELAHRNPNTLVYWHLDGEYIGSTKRIHHLALNPPEGKHVLTVVDEHGEALERRFEVISKM